MGCIQSMDAESKKNVNISRIMVQDAKDNRKQVKLLIIGAGDSGKTTLRKQMRCVYGQGFDKEAKIQSRIIVLENLIHGANDILVNCLKDVEEENIASEIIKHFGEDGQLINQLAHSKSFELTDAHAQALLRLWNENTEFRASYENKSSYHLQDCWTVFMTSFLSYPTWGGPDWIPSEEDCIRARVRTSGITEESFVIDNAVFKLFDCGGQRAERKKWIHCFDHVTAVIFVASLSEYDLTLFEDHTKSRLKETLELFSDMCNSKYFKEVPMILFLNKRDLFEEKLSKIPLNATGEFPSAPVNCDAETAITWITSEFAKRNLNPKKDLYTYVTTAVDPNNVKSVFDTCRQIILQKNLATVGFLNEGP